MHIGNTSKHLYVSPDFIEVSLTGQLLRPGNTQKVRITVWLTSYLTGLEMCEWVDGPCSPQRNWLYNSDYLKSETPPTIKMKLSQNWNQLQIIRQPLG